MPLGCAARAAAPATEALSWRWCGSVPTRTLGRQYGCWQGVRTRSFVRAASTKNAAPPHKLLFTADRRGFIRPMGVVSVLQLGVWGLFLGNGGFGALPGLTTGLVTVASLGFPAAIAVYARHYVCELSVVKRCSSAVETIEICTHTFGGGYHTVEYPTSDVESSAPVQNFRRFRIRNAIEMGGFYIVDTHRGTVPPFAQTSFDALFGGAAVDGTKTASGSDRDAAWAGNTYAWAVGDIVDVDTEERVEVGVQIIGPSTNGEPNEMQVKFADGDFADWPVKDFRQPAQTPTKK